MITIKLPRKLKKALKKAYLRNAHPAWKTSQVKIKEVGQKRAKGNIAVVGNVAIKGVTLG